jgi:predicted nucleic acid-binding protein
VPPPIFIDTAGWASFLVSHEPFHQLAHDLLRGARLTGQRAVTTNYVLAELSALLISPLRVSHLLRVELIDSIRHAHWIEVIHIDKELDRRSWAFLANHQDKDFSIVDCSSFVLMKELGISAAMTTDHHFEQAGFERLLKIESDPHRAWPESSALASSNAATAASRVTDGKLSRNSSSVSPPSK